MLLVVSLHSLLPAGRMTWDPSERRESVTWVSPSVVYRLSLLGFSPHAHSIPFRRTSEQRNEAKDREVEGGRDEGTARYTSLTPLVPRAVSVPSLVVSPSFVTYPPLLLPSGPEEPRRWRKETTRWRRDGGNEWKAVTSLARFRRQGRRRAVMGRKNDGPFLTPLLTTSLLYPVRSAPVASLGPNRSEWRNVDRRRCSGWTGL